MSTKSLIKRPQRDAAIRAMPPHGHSEPPPIGPSRRDPSEAGRVGPPPNGTAEHAPDSTPSGRAVMVDSLALVRFSETCFAPAQGTRTWTSPPSTAS